MFNDGKFDVSTINIIVTATIKSFTIRIINRPLYSVIYLHKWESSYVSTTSAALYFLEERSSS